MESGALDKLDLVLGSFHSALRGKEDQTGRYMAALNNPDIPNSGASARSDLQLSRAA
jgi:hypothetical protein